MGSTQSVVTAPRICGTVVGWNNVCTSSTFQDPFSCSRSCILMEASTRSSEAAHCRKVPREGTQVSSQTLNSVPSPTRLKIFARANGKHLVLLPQNNNPIRIRLGHKRICKF
ncbi:hypothetical protein V6N13_061284 [Hibiscus sabdariffa]